MSASSTPRQPRGSFLPLVLVTCAVVGSGCASRVRSVPFEAPPKLDDAATFVVYTRGGFTDHLIVLDREKVVGVSNRNSWFHFQAPPGEHELLLVLPQEPADILADRAFLLGRCEGEPEDDVICKGIRAAAAQPLAFACQRLMVRAEPKKVYAARVRFVSPATPGIGVASSAANAHLASVEARTQAAERSGNSYLAPTGAEVQYANQQAATAAAGDLVVMLANDPDVTPPIAPEDLNWTFRGIRDPKQLGPEGLARLASWDRVAVADPEAMQALFDRIRAAGPLVCVDEAPVSTLEAGEHLP